MVRMINKARKTSMRAKMLAISLIMICLAVVGFGTAAYFTTSGKAHNIIAMGTISLNLNEKDDKGNAFKNVMNVLPGDSVPKVVTVENSGSSPCWVRIQVEKSFILSEENQGAEVDLDLITLDINTADWTEKDGWFYYNNALQPGQTTEALFTSAAFADEMGNQYRGSQAFIDVLTQAVQTAHNGSDPLNAAGWPAEGSDEGPTEGPILGSKEGGGDK